MIPWQALEPDALPDAGRPRVPDRVRRALPVLLPSRFRQVVRIVLGANDEVVRTVGRQHRGHVGTEGRVSPLVLGDHRPIDPDGCAVVDRTEAQDQAIVGA